MQEFIEYLSQQMEAGKARIAELEAEGRRDDAAFEKVGTNIYEVCRTVTQALLNRPGFGVDAIRARFEGFETSWGEALAKAEEHDDARNIAIEKTKLSVLADVIEHFAEAEGK